MNKPSEPLRVWYELKLLVTGFVPTSDQDLEFLPIFRYPIENNRRRIGGRWWAAVALRGALPEAHRGGAGEMSASSWEISTAAHRVPPKK